MSKRIFLCGHTGSDNRGCEAIVRSTIKLFKEAGLADKPVLATSGVSQDKSAGLDKLCDIICYGKYKSTIQRYYYAGLRKFFSNPAMGQNIIQRDLWKTIDKSDLSLAIGGDTYCYKGPTIFIAHNHRMNKKGIPSVLWCSSVGRENLNNAIIQDLMKYTYIVAREPYTCNSLLEAGIPESKIIKCCDPAFTLDTKECELPAGFKPGNTVGVNFSNLVKNEAVSMAVDRLIEGILENTEMNVCLIPHVFGTIEPDMAVLSTIYERFAHTGRISIVDKEYSCEELKFIISKCRFFVGARTHASIAAYSTMVPTLVLGYSIKSLGLAKDLFGTEKGYVLPYTEIKDKEDIYNAFCNIYNNEDSIKERYKEVLPDYVQTVRDAANTLYQKFLGE